MWVSCNLRVCRSIHGLTFMVVIFVMNGDDFLQEIPLTHNFFFILLIITIWHCHRIIETHQLPTTFTPQRFYNICLNVLMCFLMRNWKIHPSVMG